MDASKDQVESFSDENISELVNSLTSSSTADDRISIYNDHCSIDKNVNALQMKKLAEAFVDPNCKVRVLSLYRTLDQRLYLAVMKELVQALTHPNCKIISLDVRGNTMDGPTIEELINVLKHPNCKILSLLINTPIPKYSNALKDAIILNRTILSEFGLRGWQEPYAIAMKSRLEEFLNAIEEILSKGVCASNLTSAQFWYWKNYDRITCEVEGDYDHPPTLKQFIAGKYNINMVEATIRNGFEFKFTKACIGNAFIRLCADALTESILTMKLQIDNPKDYPQLTGSSNVENGVLSNIKMPAEIMQRIVAMISWTFEQKLEIIRTSEQEESVKQQVKI